MPSKRKKPKAVAKPKGSTVKIPLPRREIEEKAFQLLKQMEHLSPQSEEYLNKLLFLAAESTSALNKIALENPEIMKGIAPRHLSWPMLPSQ